MEMIPVPQPEVIQQRIADCELELRSLRRLLRMALALQDAEEARQRRAHPVQEREVADGR
jgi:hypothetical protein